MKSIFKHALAVTAFVATSAANAQFFIDVSNPFGFSGTETVSFSVDAFSALSVAGATLATPAKVPANSLSLPYAGATNTAVLDKSTRQLTLSSSLMSIEGNGLTGLSAPSSFVQLSRVLISEEGDVIGTRKVYLMNWELDLAQGTVYADVITTSLLGDITGFGKQAVFQATEPGIVGGSGGILAGGTMIPMASGSLAGELRLTSQGGDAILAGLGLGTGTADSAANFWRQTNWGTVSFTVPAVPEPSSWALFSVGLVGAALARRRARQA